MTFDKNSWVIYLIASIIIIAVLGQAVFFMVRALKRAKKLNMDKTLIKKTIISSAIFTIAPAIAIVISVLSLSRSLGIPLPWFRLSVVGSNTYETFAAEEALKGMGFAGLKAVNFDAQTYVTVVFVMTISIMLGVVLTPVLSKKLQKGMINLGKKDKAWSEVFTNALFIGMISAFLGLIFGELPSVFKGNLHGLVPLFVLVTSALVMILCGLVKKLTGWRWITDYALPISMIVGMAMAIPYTLLFPAPAVTEQALACLSIL